MIEFAAQEAMQMNMRSIGSEFLLLGLLREVEGVAWQVLIKLGLELETARHEVRRIISPP